MCAFRQKPPRVLVDSMEACLDSHFEVCHVYLSIAMVIDIILLALDNILESAEHDIFLNKKRV